MATLPWRLGLRAKVAGLVVGASSFAALTVAALFYYQSRALEREGAAARLASVGELHAQLVASGFARMEADAGILSRMPPIQGIIRASQSADGADLLDPSDLGQWERRLANIFANVLEARPQYLAIRFLDTRGRPAELVDVARSVEGVAVRREPAAPDQAPSPRGLPGAGDDGEALDGSEPFLTAVMPGASPGARGSSAIASAVIEVVQPIHDAKGRPFGLVIIDVDYLALMSEVALRLDPELRTLAITDRLDWVEFPAEGGARVHLRSDPDWSMPPIVVPVDWTRTGARTIETDAALVDLHPVFTAGPDRPFGLVVATEVTKAQLFALWRNSLGQTAAAAAALILICGLIAALLVRRTLDRLQHLTQRLREGGAEALDGSASRDELGELAAVLGRDLARETIQRRAVFVGVTDGIIAIGPDGVIEDANPAVERLFGYGRAELIGARIDMLMPQDIRAHHQSYLDRPGPKGAPRLMGGNRDIHGLCKNGGTIPLEISVSRIEHSGSVHFIGVVRDISLRKEAEERTARLLAALERSNAELDTFAYVASHDLRAPLRVIDNASRWLEEDLAEHLDDDTRESMDLLRSRVARMDRLLDDLLQHSRIGRTTMDTAPISGADLVDELSGLLVPRAGIRFEATPAVKAIELPKMPILTVLLNLVNNAIKHHDREAGRVVLDVLEHDVHYEFTVTDDGPGIPPSYHALVFEMFQTLRPRDVVDGSGMGLAIVKKHLAIVGGRIEIESDGARGARFRVIWPRSVEVVAEEKAA